MEPARPYHGKRVWCLGFHISLGSLIYGYHLGVVNTSYKEVARALGVSSSDGYIIAMLSSALLVGAAIGSLVSGYLTSRIGRRRVTILGDIAVILGAGLTVLPHLAAFLCGRVISGISCGVFASICPIYIGEYSPSRVRGKVGSLMQTNLTLGLVLSYCIGIPLPTGATDSPMQYWWMVMELIPIPIALYMLCVFAFGFRLDTPYWLGMKGYSDECQASLEYLYPEPALPAAKESLQIRIVTTQELLTQETVTMAKLFCTQRYSQMMRLGCFVNVVKQFSGNSSILFYSALILNQSGGSEMASRLYSALIGLSNLAFALVAMAAISKSGRKTLMVWGSLVLGLDMLLLGLYLQLVSGPIYPTVIMLCVFMCVFQCSLGSVSWVYCGEIMNDKGLGVANTVGMIGNFAIVFLFPILQQALGLGYAFLFHAAIVLVAAAYFQFDMIETKQLTRAEIAKIIEKAPSEMNLESSPSTGLNIS